MSPEEFWQLVEEGALELTGNIEQREVDGKVICTVEAITVHPLHYIHINAELKL
jgi:hypothetical protein